MGKRQERELNELHSSVTEAVGKARTEIRRSRVAASYTAQDGAVESFRRRALL